MHDIEKVINGLGEIQQRFAHSLLLRQEYDPNDDAVTDIIYKADIDLLCDAIELLKEQKPVKPVLEQGSMVCGDCGHDVIIQRFIGGEVFDEKVSFCPACGSAVNWKIND